MEFFKKQTNIDFMGLRKYTAIFSVVLCIACIICLFLKGLNLGLDFTGGTQLEVRYPAAIQLDTLRQTLDTAGFGDAKIQHYGSTSDILIRLRSRTRMTEEQLADDIVKNLKEKDPDVQLKRVEIVGAEVGAQLFEQGGMALLVALLATMIYIAMRFEYRFAVSAVIALLHDPIVILGAFSFFQIEFDLATLAAVLAIIGYSLNDTIVVFDRVRENFYHFRKMPALDVMNMSINQTLSRTIMTSGSTLLVVIALLIYGGESLFGFSLALTIGILIGTYSSIYVAGALAVSFGLSRADLVIAAKKAVDDRP